MSPNARRHSTAAAPWRSACARPCGESRATVLPVRPLASAWGSRGHGVAPRHGIVPRSMSRRASRRGRAPPGKADRRGPLRWPRPPRTHTTAVPGATPTISSRGAALGLRQPVQGEVAQPTCGAASRRVLGTLAARGPVACRRAQPWARRAAHVAPRRGLMRGCNLAQPVNFQELLERSRAHPSGSAARGACAC